MATHSAAGSTHIPYHVTRPSRVIPNKRNIANHCLHLLPYCRYHWTTHTTTYYVHVFSLADGCVPKRKARTSRSHSRTSLIRFGTVTHEGVHQGCPVRKRAAVALAVTDREVVVMEARGEEEAKCAALVWCWWQHWEHGGVMSKVASGSTNQHRDGASSAAQECLSRC